MCVPRPSPQGHSEQERFKGEQRGDRQGLAVNQWLTATCPWSGRLCASLLPYVHIHGFQGAPGKIPKIQKVLVREQHVERGLTSQLHSKQSELGFVSASSSIINEQQFTAFKTSLILNGFQFQKVKMSVLESIKYGVYIYIVDINMYRIGTTKFHENLPNSKNHTSFCIPQFF